MRVLIVDDSTYIRNTLKSSLLENGYEIAGEAKDGEEAIDLAIELKPDIITLDNILPDMTGIDILNILKDKELKPFVIMISAIGQESTRVRAEELGVSHYLTKPIDHQNLVNILKEAGL